MMRHLSVTSCLIAVTAVVGSANALHAQGRGPSGQGKTKTSAPAKPPTNTVAIHLARQPQLSAKVQALLPAGTDLRTASEGFTSVGGFVAALHVSKNLDIRFDALKVRLTAPKPESLGQSIHELKPAVDSAAEVKKAEAQARADQKVDRR